MIKTVDVAIAVIFDAAGEKILVCQRKADTVLGGYWEFPGGKRDGTETMADCARREVREEVGIEVAILGGLPVIEHSYPHAYVRLHPFICRHTGGTPQSIAVATLTWAGPNELGEFQFPPPNVGLVREVSKGFAAVQEMLKPAQ